MKDQRRELARKITHLSVYGNRRSHPTPPVAVDPFQVVQGYPIGEEVSRNDDVGGRERLDSKGPRH